jgi:predicted regulator of Ras-like GTPase activity (Roadblock/LC7/MglB family)/CheY-like chemotaxis protein
MEAVEKTRLGKILVIHQSREAREEFGRAMLGRIDFLTVDDCEKGWQSVVVDPTIRAVVASLPMIELDGFGLLQHLRASKVPRIRRLPVAIVAGEESNLIDELALSFGATDVIAPNLGEDALLERLAALLDPARPGTRPSRVPLAQTSGAESAAAPAPADKEPAARAAAPAQSAPAGQIPIEDPPTRHRQQAGAAPIARENAMARFENLTKVMKTLQSSSPGVEASALISSDGLMIASALSQDLEESRVAGMTATLLNLGTRAATELGRGEVAEIVVRGEHGYAVVISAGRGTLLLVLATEATPLGLILFDMREAAKAIKTIL